MRCSPRWVHFIRTHKRINAGHRGPSTPAARTTVAYITTHLVQHKDAPTSAGRTLAPAAARRSIGSLIREALPSLVSDNPLI